MYGQDYDKHIQLEIKGSELLSACDQTIPNGIFCIEFALASTEPLIVEIKSKFPITMIGGASIYKINSIDGICSFDIINLGNEINIKHNNVLLTINKL